VAGWHKVQLKKNIHLKLRVFIVDEPKIDFVEPKRFTINLPSVGAPVAIRTEGDKVIILMRLTVEAYPADSGRSIGSGFWRTTALWGAPRLMMSR
jgi:hypothetical protein